MDAWETKIIDHQLYLESSLNSETSINGDLTALWGTSWTSISRQEALMVELEKNKQSRTIPLMLRQTESQTAAYWYPNVLLPPSVWLRFPVDMVVDPVFQTSNPKLKWRMKSDDMMKKLLHKVTFLVVFSGQPLWGLSTGTQWWTDIYDKITGNVQWKKLMTKEKEKELSDWHFNRRSQNTIEEDRNLNNIKF